MKELHLIVKPTNQINEIYSLLERSGFEYTIYSCTNLWKAPTYVQNEINCPKDKIRFKDLRSLERKLKKMKFWDKLKEKSFKNFLKKRLNNLINSKPYIGGPI